MNALFARNRKHRATRRGYTLLEVMLVLLITMVLVTAVGAALNIYLRSVEAGRAEVEQAQLARALLRRIADDLRSAVPVVVDSSTAEASTASSALSGAISAATSGSSGGGSGGGSGSSAAGSSSANITNITGSTGVTNIGGSSGSTSSGTTSASSAQSASSTSGSSGGASGSSSGGSRSGGSSSGSGSSGGMSSSGGSGSSGSGSSSGSSAAGGSSATETESTGEATIAPLGVYGNQYDIQLDVSRLPRIDRMDSLTGAITPDGIAAVGDPPSDVKTVAYFIVNTVEYVAADSGGAATVVSSGGLVRRQVDRSIVNYGTLYGGSTDEGTREQVLAPEATALEFRYFDGTEWLTSWSSSDRGAVPVAIEILLTLRAAEAAPVGSTLLLASPSVPQEQTYRLMVHLPAGEPSTAGEVSATEDTSSAATENSP